MFSVHAEVNWTMFNGLFELILDNLTFNFNSLFGIVYAYGSFSIQIPNGGRMWFRPAIFIWRVYVAISHRYDLKRVSLKSWITVLSLYVKI